MDLSRIASIYRARWRIFASVFLLSCLTAVALILLTPREYTANAQVFVSATGASDPSQLAQGNSFSEARVQSYTQVASSPLVTRSVVNSLSLNESPDTLAAKIKASSPPSTVLIDLAVTDRNAQVAADLTNAVASRFVTVVEQIEANSDTSVSPVKLTVTRPAEVPGSPSNPNVSLVLGLGVAGGVILGIVAMIARDLLDRTFRSGDQLGRAGGAAVLAVIPMDKRAPSAPIAIRLDSHGMRAEAFRQLRTNLQFLNVDMPPTVIAVTSAVPGEGKTHCAVNLAASLAEGGKRVCLIEADLRRPSIAKYLGLVSEVGLTNILIGQSEVEQVLQNAGANLAVITSGPTPPNPAELLSSGRLATTVEFVAGSVDYVIIDTPPVLAVADSAEVCALAEATLLVVRAGATTTNQLDRALEALRNVEIVPSGSILSMSRQGSDSQQYYYYAD